MSYTCARVNSEKSVSLWTQFGHYKWSPLSVEVQGNRKTDSQMRKRRKKGETCKKKRQAGK